MRIPHLPCLALLLLAVVVTVAIRGALAGPILTGSKQSGDDQKEPETKNAQIKKLLTERLATLRELVKATDAEYRAGKVSFDRVQQAQRALLNARLELCESDKERITVLEDTVALAKENERTAAQRYKTGVATQSDVLLATAARLQAEIALERIRAKAPNPGK